MSRDTPSGRQVQVQGTADLPASSHSSIAKLTASVCGQGRAQAWGLAGVGSTRVAILLRPSWLLRDGWGGGMPCA